MQLEKIITGISCTATDNNAAQVQNNPSNNHFVLYLQQTQFLSAKPDL
jgi:hypothetical protein